MGKAKNFLIGLGIGVLGAILWIAASVTGGFIEGFSGERDSVLYALMVIGFFVMVGGPFTFWIILPIRRAMKKRRSRSTGGGSL
jgi:hypothetical protein